MASNSCAWLSVIVKEGLKLVQRSKIISCNWENSFGDLLLKSYSTERRVVKVEISQTDQFLSTHEVCLYSYIARAILLLLLLNYVCM